MSETTSAKDASGEPAGAPELPDWPVRPPVPFSYKKPEAFKGVKAGILLAQTDLVRARVQVIREGGANNLHWHLGVDTVWMVLKGRARFYGPDNVLIADLGVHEGMVTPRGNQYWFESAGEEELELLQIAAFEKGARARKVDMEPLAFPRSEYPQFDMRRKAGAKAGAKAGG